MASVSDVIEISSLSPEQKYAYNKFVQGENLFITGPGGTGKTRLVKYLLEHSKSIGKNTQVCAMTGCAAVLLQCNARTIHSWSGIKLAKGPKDRVIETTLKNRNAIKAWKSAKCLILDEISMLSKKIFEIIEEVARRARKSSEVFGGLLVVFIGDFYQLPPISTDGEPDTEKFCFESPIWKRVFKEENHIELTTIFRQTDPIYKNILLQIRKGTISEENKQILQGYVNREFDPMKNNGCIPTKLFAIRSKVDYVNTQMFSKIQEKEFILEHCYKNDCLTYLDSGKVIPHDVLQKCNALSVLEKEMELDQILNNSQCNKIIRLKKGAAVMCTINLDMDLEICNGSQGIVIDIIETNGNINPIVKFSNGIIKRIEKHYWQSEEYPTLAVGQYPLCLAWALTIHKIQGATLGMAEIDIGRSIFEYGQTYVALSRIQSLEGLYLSAFEPHKIKANPIVTAFYESIVLLNLTECEKIETKMKDVKVITLMNNDYVVKDKPPHER